MIISKEKMMQVIKEEHSVDVDEAKFRIQQTLRKQSYHHTYMCFESTLVNWC